MLSTKTKIIIGAVVGVLILILIYFGLRIFVFKGGSLGPIKLTYWGYQDEEKDMKTLIDAYQEKHTNVSIEYKKLGENPEDYEKIVTDAIASDESPDIFQIRNDWVPKHYKKLAPVPDSTYKMKDFEKNFFEVAKTDLSYKDKLYAIPFNIDTLALFYNTSLFQEKNVNNPSDTWDKVKEDIKELRDINGTYVNSAGIALGTANNTEYAQDILYLLMLQSKTNMTSADFSKAYFNLSVTNKDGNLVYPGTSALEFYTSFADPTKENYTWNTSMPNSIDAFASGKTAMTLGYASDIKKIKKATNEKLNFQVVPCPQVLGENIYYAKYWANGVSKNSKNEKAAWEFLKFASSKEQLIKYLDKTEMPAARKDVAELQQSNMYLSVFTEQAKTAKGWYKGDWEKTDKAFKELINDVIMNKQPAQAAMDAAAKKVTTNLEDFKKKE